MKLIINTDGGARGNPGPAAIGVVIKNSKGEKIFEMGKFIGNTTNNDAEYQALIEGLTAAKEKGGKMIECILDSELVVKQMTGLYKVKNETIKIHFQKIKQLENSFDKVTYKHVLRSENKDADKVVNKVLDSII